MELKMTWTDYFDTYTMLGTVEEVESQYLKLVRTGEFYRILVEHLDNSIL